MFAKFVAPIAVLMHRLSFQHKFVLAGGLMVAALGMALIPGVVRMLVDYEELQRRRDGVAAIRGVVGAIGAVAEHRQARLAASRGLPAGDADPDALGGVVDVRLAALGGDFGEAANKARTEAAAAWSDIRQRLGGRYSAVRVAADHAVLLAALARHAEGVAVGSGVGGETEAGAQFLAGLLAHELPRLLLDLSDAMVHGAAAAAGVLNDEDRLRLGYLSQHLVRESAAIADAQGLRLPGEALAADAGRLTVGVPALANLLLNNAVLHPENALSAEALALAGRAAARAAPPRAPPPRWPAPPARRWKPTWRSATATWLGGSRSSWRRSSSPSASPLMSSPASGIPRARRSTPSWRRPSA